MMLANGSFGNEYLVIVTVCQGIRDVDMFDRSPIPPA
jgi:hypothetical protein